MVTRIPALIFDGIVEIGCLYFLYFVMVVIAVMNCQFTQVPVVELARTTTANPRIRFKRPGSVALLALFPVGMSLRDDTIKFLFGAFH
jgi:hypothetical protein